MMHFVAVYHQLTNRSFGVGTVYGNAKSIGAVSRSITPIKRLLNMVDIVLQQFNMGAGAHNTDAQRSEPAFGGVVVSNFKAFDPDVTLIMNRQDATSALRNQMLCVEDCRLAGIAS